MRISTSWNQQLGVNALLEQQTKVSQTQMQLSSGLKILQPADDPVASSQILAFKQEIEQTDQYQRNIDMARERNRLEESTLASAEETLFRAKELTIQAANDALNDNDRLAIKAEIDQLLDNMLSLANTKNANGEFIFAGYKTDTQPFAWDDALSTYQYFGSDDQRQIQISPERRVADGDSGLEVFEEIPSVSQEAAAGDGARSIFNTLKSLSDALAGVFPTGLIPNQTGDLFFTITDEVLADLNNAQESFLQARTAAGARLRTLDNQEAQNEKFILDLKTALSDVEDLDYAEAISRFNLQNTALQAAQQSFSRVQNLSLFNYL